MDQLREDSRERTWEDYVEDAGTALALGAGAVYFFKHGGAQYLGRFSEYLKGAKRAYAEGAFDHFNLKNGIDKTKEYVLKRQMESKLDVGNGPMMQSLFEGANIMDKGKRYSAMVEGFKRSFQEDYGHALYEEMAPHIQYMSREEADILRGMIPDFTKSTEMSLLGIGAAIRKRFGEIGSGTSQEAVNEAIVFANELQNKIRVDTERIIESAGNTTPYRIDIGEFKGFLFGQGVWDTSNVVRHIEEVNPVEKTQQAGEAALNILEKLRAQREYYSTPLERAKTALLGQHVTVGETIEAIERGELDKEIFASRPFLDIRQNDVFTNSYDALLEIRNRYSANMTGAEEFNNIIIGGLRRDSSGQIYSTAGMEDLLSEAGEALADTLPGKLLRTTEALYKQQQPMFAVFNKGTLDYTLSKALGNMEYEMETARDVLRIDGRFYSYLNGQWQLDDVLKDLTLAPGKIGASRDLFQGVRDAERAKMRGMDKFFDSIRNVRKSGTKILSEKYGNQFNWGFNNPDMDHYDVFHAAINDVARNNAEGADILNRISGLHRSVDRFAHLQNELDVASLEQLQRQLLAYNQANPGSIPLSSFKYLQYAINIAKDPQKAIQFASQHGSLSTSGSIHSHELSNLIANFKKNQRRTVQQHITRVDQAKKAAGSVHFYSQPFDQQLAQELVRESFFRITEGNNATGKESVDIVSEIINNVYTGNKASNMRSFVAAGIFKQRTRYGVYDIRDDVKALETLEYLRKIHQKGTAEDRFVLNAMEELKTRFNFKGEQVNFLADAEAKDRAGEWAVVRKAYGFPSSIRTAMDLVRNANENEKGKAFLNAIREAAKPITQFVSGNDRAQALSEYSYFGYNIANLVDKQLNRSFNLFGRHFELRLGLDKKDKGSAAAIMTNLVLKRVAPVAFGLTYLDFIDDTARAVLGQGLGEAGVSGLANAYLAVKKVTGATHLDYALKGITSDSPWADYYAGYTGDINPEWKTYEEQKDYYERGYTPIRKARFWKFGSSNEYRGGRVSYFEPNTLRMMRSNYFMESMYEGSMWTKWSHSLLPTPLNPLSPINYILDPYYLEELHKEDRPYPVTGSTFAENTPWGIALNPIFDTFIKPRRQMYRDRLGEDGIDVKALIAHINDNIRRKTNNQQNGDILYLQNGKLRSMLFTAFNAPTPSERIVGQQGASVTASTEYSEYGAGIEAEEYPQLAESNADQLRSQAIAGSAMGAPVQGGKLSIADKLVISSAKGNFAAGMLVDSMKVTGVFDALRGANMKIREQGMLHKDQGFFYENKMQYERSSVEDLLSDSEMISDLMTQGKGHDYIHEMAVSARMITGLYGYMASLAFGIGQNNQKRIATSANMESAGRSFWDLNIGGYDPTGGDIMEIIRRFIPEYHRMQQVNPLMNTMPDWLPERMRFGDPYTAIPKGEARLPGRGYESLNQLHPDVYGRYGAFDRFKILADVAPYSPEYKFWKKIAGATIQDPELKKEMQEIKDRVAEQTQGHDFYDYRYIGRDMVQQNAVVSEVMNFGKFKIVGSEQVYKLSGVKIAGNPDETTQQVLSRYLLPGQEITMYMDENPAYARNNDKDQTINAGVMVAGENIAEQMLEAGDAKKRKGDTSAPSYMLNHGNFVNGLNTVQEFIGHLNIPIFHSRFMNINSPLESYKDDNVYGTSFQSWSDIWGTFVRPTLQIEASSPYVLSTGIIANIINNNVQNEGKQGIRNLIREALENSDTIKALGKEASIKGPASEGIRKWASRGAYFLDRGALAGHFAGRIWFMGSSEALSKSQRLQHIGSTVGVAYAALAAPENLGVSTISWSRLGYLFANEYMHKNRMAITIAGAAIGAARWAASQKWLASDDTANTYIPDATRRKWDMQEYFDRLTYIKYMGLFEQAADMAKEKEGIDIRRILASQEQEREELSEQKERLKKDLRDLDRTHSADSEEAKKIIRRHLSKMSGVKLAMRGGEFTKSAVMYKNAADATVYGLKKDALMADIVRALPKTERDYFIEFMKEKDADKRKEILSTVSPMLNRALRTIWKMPLPEKVSNEEYFEHHTLPAPTWAGWRPDIDLANVEAKVIYNQGMQFSDMGIYASQYREPAVINAPNIDYSQEQRSTLLTRLKLQMALTGTGLDASKVSVEPSQDSGIQVIANVARVIPYKISEEFENLFTFN